MRERGAVVAPFGLWRSHSVCVWSVRGRRGGGGGGGLEDDALLVVGFELRVEAAELRVLGGKDVDVGEDVLAASGEAGGGGFGAHSVGGHLLEVVLCGGGSGLDGEVG